MGANHLSVYFQLKKILRVNDEKYEQLFINLITCQFINKTRITKVCCYTCNGCYILNSIFVVHNAKRKKYNFMHLLYIVYKTIRFSAKLPLIIIDGLSIDNWRYLDENNNQVHQKDRLINIDQSHGLCSSRT